MIQSFLLWALLKGSTSIAEPYRPDEDTHSSLVPVLIKQGTLHYPPEANNQTGEVILVVDVNSKGRVLNARVEDGPSVFHKEAIAAAYRLQFEPLMKNGVAIQFTTKASFYFAPPEHLEKGDLYADHSIVIFSDSLHERETRSSETLDEQELESRAAVDLSRSISSISGVTFAGTAANTSKPIIRGQLERRLLLIQDGIHHESQKWSPDHAPEIDPFSAGSITVIKGANGVRYGPDAIGGVILIEQPEFQSEAGVTGKVTNLFATNGQQFYTAGRVDYSPEGMTRWKFRTEGNWLSSKDIQSPNYILGNTASKNWNAGSAIQYSHNDRLVRFTQRHYSNQNGVFYGVQNSTPDEFEAQITRTRPLMADTWTVDRTIEDPRQTVLHDTLSVHYSDRAFDWMSTELIYAFQRNHRQEYELTRGYITDSKYDFTLRTHSLDSFIDIDDLYFRGVEFDTQLGVAGKFQENVYRGYSLIPNYRSFAGGAYLIERLVLQRGAIESGLRFDAMNRQTFLKERDYQEHQREGTLAEQDCIIDGEVYRCDQQYKGVSTSVGVIWEFFPQHVEGRLDLSSAVRFPNSDELFILGSAPTFPVFAYGNPNMPKEQTKGISPTLAVQTKWIQTEISGYANWMTNYIYFVPAVTDDGQLSYKVTIQGAFPKYVFRPIDAFFYGVDGSVSIAPEAIIGGEITGSVVRGQEIETGEFLIGIPPDQMTTSVQVRPPLQKLNDFEINLASRFVASQTRVNSTLDFASAPDAFWLLDAEVSMAIPIRNLDARAYLSGRNLLNTAYREYMSLMRYYSDEPGRDIRTSVTIDF